MAFLLIIDYTKMINPRNLKTKEPEKISIKAFDNQDALNKQLMMSMPISIYKTARIYVIETYQKFRTTDIELNQIKLEDFVSVREDTLETQKKETFEKQKRPEEKDSKKLSLQKLTELLSNKENFFKITQQNPQFTQEIFEAMLENSSTPEMTKICKENPILPFFLFAQADKNPVNAAKFLNSSFAGGGDFTLMSNGIAQTIVKHISDNDFVSAVTKNNRLSNILNQLVTSSTTSTKTLRNSSEFQNFLKDNQHIINNNNTLEKLLNPEMFGPHPQKKEKTALDATLNPEELKRMAKDTTKVLCHNAREYVDSGVDFYALLNMNKNEPTSNLLQHYREAAKKHHADPKIMTILNSAKDILSNKESRQVYDEAHEQKFVAHKGYGR